MDIALEVDKKYALELQGLMPRISARIANYTRGIDMREVSPARRDPAPAPESFAGSELRRLSGSHHRRDLQAVRGDVTGEPVSDPWCARPN